jgi:hypothetical protein
MSLKLYLKRRTNEERIADALGEVRAGLKHIKDPRVWGGYPDGWPDNADDEDEPGALLGLVLNLERCTRGDSTWQMAMAIEIAFALGKVTQTGELDAQTWRRLLSGASRAQINAGKSANKRGKKATSQLAMIERIVAEERAQSPDLDRGALARLTWERMEKNLGHDCPAESTIYDAIRKKIDGKLASGRKATRRENDTRRI